MLFRFSASGKLKKLQLRLFNILLSYKTLRRKNLVALKFDNSNCTLKNCNSDRLSCNTWHEKYVLEIEFVSYKYIV